MKVKNVFLSGSMLALLAACADLGFGEATLAEAPQGSAGPVMVADLDPSIANGAPTPLVTTPSAPVIRRAPPAGAVTIAELSDVKPKAPVPMQTAAVTPIKPVTRTAPSVPSTPAAAKPTPAPVQSTPSVEMASLVPKEDEAPKPATETAAAAAPEMCFEAVTIPAKTETETKQRALKPSLQPTKP